MPTGDAILVIGLLIVAVVVFLSGFHFMRPLIWMASSAMWIISAVVSYTLSTVEWDSFFFMFWISVGFSIITLLLVFQTREMDNEEIGNSKHKNSDLEDAISDAEEYRKAQERYSNATGGTVAERRRRNGRRS